MYKIFVLSVPVISNPPLHTILSPSILIKATEPLGTLIFKSVDAESLAPSTSKIFKNGSEPSKNILDPS